ncbi:MAG: Glucoamylase, intracellular sporulation-specific [Pycnora praestabilis]|nr:MAG: Glucoamylase, intracellular sporulation-specific [Pycnora praestabilis]
MLVLVTFVFLGYLFLYAIAFTDPPQSFEQSASAQYPLNKKTLPLSSNFLASGLPLNAWLDNEKDIALLKLLANIAPSGRNTQGAIPGTVIASPSKQHPDYYFQWIRDAAITTSTLVNIYSSESASNLTFEILEALESYASLQYRLQHTNNPSGWFTDLSSLGEPKFHTDGTPFIGNWGRPQRDGPALRALTLMAYLRAYNETHPTLWTSSEGGDWYRELYDPSMPANSIIKADLEYLSHHWQDSGFDLWEEIDGLHFFTAMVQMRALRAGAKLADDFGDEGARAWYLKQEAAMRHFVPNFWDDEREHLVATKETTRSGLDCGVLLGALHGVDSEDLEDFTIFSPQSDEVLVSMLDLIEDQRFRFPINALAAASSDLLAGVGIGRYPEDVYNGDGTSIGNPWFLCTASVSEVLYRNVVHLERQGWLNVTTLGFRFWHALSPDLITDTGNFTMAGVEFKTNLQRMKDVGDSFLAVVKEHANGDGSLSEQFDGVTGFERGARDLTWSYGALLEAIKWRRRAMDILQK